MMNLLIIIYSLNILVIKMMVKEDNIKNALLGIFTVNYSDMTEEYIKDNQL